MRKLDHYGDFAKEDHYYTQLMQVGNEHKVSPEGMEALILETRQMNPELQNALSTVLRRQLDEETPEGFITAFCKIVAENAHQVKNQLKASKGV